jgi:predicted O-methyltransferase YrrM
MDLINAQLQKYAEQYSSAEDELLKKVSEHTRIHHPKAHMLSGHLQGKLLEMISCMIKPKRILDIGTFTGYSALCLAKGLDREGILHTIEVRDSEGKTAQAFFDQSFFKDRIILHIGEALGIIGEMDDQWDLVFIDADKENYIHYFNLVLPKLQPNGFILADNTLFHGQVLGGNIKGKSAKAVQAFNEHLLMRTDVEKVLLPLRDGITLIRKL